MDTTPDQHVATHRAAGRTVSAGGLDAFVREQGDGPTVLCLHGVPVSSYLYRKVVPELADRGCRAIAYDLPGLGFTARPPAFDYSWTGMAAWSATLVDALGLDDVHLVVHDVGGPVGLLLADLLGADRVRSITVLNTIVDPTRFTPPPVMRPFTVPVLGEAWLRSTIDPAFLALMRWQGVADRSVTAAELLAHRRILLHGDGGDAFLRIMRSYEYDAGTAARMRAGLHAADHRQVVWGERDPALRLDEYGTMARDVAGVDTIHRLPGKHFLQEDCAPSIARLVATLVARAN